ncbi:MAG: sensor histidine kinase [Hydrogenophaga sp.]|nr:sensor histidine kinase [Hydrogenophaga sp.]
MALRIAPGGSSASTAGGGAWHWARCSLQARLWWAASALIVAGLVVAAFGLNGLFRSYVEVDLAQRMQRHLDALIAAAAVDTAAAPAAGGAAAPTAGGTPTLVLQREPADPQFRQPAGGLYWVVFRPGAEPLRSRSWWDHEPGFAPPADLAVGALARLSHPGPGGGPLAIWMRRVQLPALEESVVFAVAADASHLEQAGASFARNLALSLLLLAAVLLLAVTLQVRLGLVPLQQLQAALKRLRSGERERLEGRFPHEVQPLVDDLNRVLQDNQAMVARAQAQAGNLAHALKTPLSVLGNLARQSSPPDPAVLQAELERMQRQIDLHLVRARAAATAHGGRSRAALDALMPPLVRTLRTLHPGLELQVHAGGAAVVRMDAHDLQEVVGNLLDNACRWARHRVDLGWHRDGGALVLQIDDDGPGIAPAAREAALQRGTRLDESQPGSGLGLAIVVELLELYGGGLRLDTAPAGGLRAELRLPLLPDGTAG